MGTFFADRMRVEGLISELGRRSVEDQFEIMQRLEQEAEARSKFKRNQLIRVCRSPGFSLVKMEAHPHNHADPDQHFDSRVIGWDFCGSIEVATIIYNNPHRAYWPWSEDMIHPREAEDWVLKSKFAIGMNVMYTWDSRPFFKIRPGDEIAATLVAPHIMKGDWLISYHNTSSGFITRVINELQMHVQPGNE